jgi:hypothetical protein
MHVQLLMIEKARLPVKKGYNVNRRYVILHDSTL